MTIELDGKPVVADADASIASALVGAGHLLLARSPKFHRPRGPSCMRGGCDGCLMRVDGVPNVMTCMRPAREGVRVQRQNVTLTPRVDPLRAADWLFPKGMNHHEVFAGVPALGAMVQAFARRISGLGDLPDAPAEASREGVPALAADALVVGAGLSGLLAANALARTGRRVVVVDDRPSPGGALLSFPRGARLEGDGTEVDALLAELLDEAVALGVEVHTCTTVVGVLEGDDWLVDRIDGLVRAVAPIRVVATGVHDATPSFEGNDLPGVLSARAAGRLLRDGVLVGEQLVVDGDGPFARAFVDAARSEGARVEHLRDGVRVESVRGLSRVRSVVARDESGHRVHLDADAVVFDAPGAPSFELAVEAGAKVRHEPRGFVVEVGPAGRVRDSVYAIGEVTGAPLAVDLLRREAARLAESAAEVRT